MAGKYDLKVKARLALPSIWQPFEEGGKYNACLIIEDQDVVERCEKAAKELINEKWRGAIKSKKALKNYYLHDGEEKEQYEGFAGNMYISASNKSKPTIVDRDGRTPLTEKDGRPYSGCWVFAYIQLWAQSNQWGKGVNATLRGLQFVADDTPFAGAPPMELDEFEELEPIGDDELAKAEDDLPF